MHVIDFNFCSYNPHTHNCSYVSYIISLTTAITSIYHVKLTTPILPGTLQRESSEQSDSSGFADVVDFMSLETIAGSDVDCTYLIDGSEDEDPPTPTLYQHYAEESTADLANTYGCLIGPQLSETNDQPSNSKHFLEGLSDTNQYPSTTVDKTPTNSMDCPLPYDDEAPISPTISPNTTTISLTPTPTTISPTTISSITPIISPTTSPTFPTISPTPSTTSPTLRMTLLATISPPAKHSQPAHSDLESTNNNKEINNLCSKNTFYHPSTSDLTDLIRPSTPTSDATTTETLEMSSSLNSDCSSLPSLPPSANCFREAIMEYKRVLFELDLKTTTKCHRADTKNSKTIFDGFQLV